MPIKCDEYNQVCVISVDGDFAGGEVEAARKVFDEFPPSAQRDYIEWITEAKQEATRQKRLAQAVEWIAEGKRRNWKYENC